MQPLYLTFSKKWEKFLGSSRLLFSYSRHHSDRICGHINDLVKDAYRTRGRYSKLNSQEVSSSVCCTSKTGGSDGPIGIDSGCGVSSHIKSFVTGVTYSERSSY